MTKPQQLTCLECMYRIAMQIRGNQKRHEQAKPGEGPKPKRRRFVYPAEVRPMVLGAPTYLQRRHENASEVGQKKLAKRHQGPDEHIKDAEVIQRDSQGTSSSLMNLEHDLSNMHSRIEEKREPGGEQGVHLVHDISGLISPEITTTNPEWTCNVDPNDIASNTRAKTQVCSAKTVQDHQRWQKKRPSSSSSRLEPNRNPGEVSSSSSLDTKQHGMLMVPIVGDVGT